MFNSFSKCQNTLNVIEGKKIGIDVLAITLSNIISSSFILFNIKHVQYMFY
jgi:hypothetical protein